MAKRPQRNLACTAGDDYDHEITFVQSDGVTPQNVSTWTFAAKVREDYASASGTAFSIDTTNAATGVIILSLSDTQTLALSGKTGVWDVDRTVSGKTLTVMGGSFAVAAQATY